MEKRYRSITPELLGELQGGKLKFMVEWAQLHPERLILCLRGERVILYDRSHVFLAGYMSKHIPVLKVSINHIKADSNAERNGEEKKQQFAEEFGFTVKHKEATKTISAEPSKVYVASLYDYLADMMDAFFGTNSLLEKRRQQEIFNLYKNKQDGYFIYDIEYAEPHKNLAEKKADKHDNRTDMLALRYQDGIPVALAFIELKAKKSACGNKEIGIKAHLSKMCGAIDSKAEYMTERTTAAYEVMKQYGQLNLYHVLPEIKPGRGSLPPEVIIYLTDEAIDYRQSNPDDFIAPLGWKYEEITTDGALIIIYTHPQEA